MACMVVEGQGAKLTENVVLLSRFAAVILKLSDLKPNLKVITIVGQKVLALASKPTVQTQLTWMLVGHKCFQSKSSSLE